jgi:molybdate transport system ATP-binding protein
MSGLFDADIRLALGRFQLEARFSAPAEGITALFGPSGSGKSSVLSVLAGLKRSFGHVQLGERILADSEMRIHMSPHKRGIGLVFQDAPLFPHLTARQNIGYAWRLAPQSMRPPIADIVKFFDIAAYLDRPISNLSGGEKSRVALARAIASAPEFLLLDEPFAALDGTRRRAFIQTLLAMHKTYALPMMVVTHQIEDAAALASHLIALKDGRVVANGPFVESTLAPRFRDLLDARDTGAAIPAHLMHAGKDDLSQSYWLRADQVMLAAEQPHAISARNVFPAIVRSFTQETRNDILVELQTDAGTLFSRITPEALSELKLARGKRAWALVKMHAL